MINHCMAKESKNCTAAQALLTQVGVLDEIKPAPLYASKQLVLYKSKAPIIPN